MVRRYRKDIIALFLLLLAVTGLFLPAMAGWRGIFHDDQAMAEFPWHYFLARHFQRGEIPLWEPNTWCGAIPFYARYYADTYYLPLWPFYWLTRIGNLNQAYWMLCLLPLLFHYWLAGAGMYVFTRQGIRMRPLPAFVTAWVYLFSPAFSYSYVWFPIVAVQAWLPWLLNLVVAMDRKPGWGRVAGAAVILALMSSAAQPPHLGYSVLLAFMVALGLSLRRFLRKETFRAVRAPLQLILAVVLSVLLAAVYWFSALDGLPHTEQHLALTYEDVAGKDGSLPPLYLVSLFAPDLFGTVTGRHMWGADITYDARYWEANMSGGLLLIFLALGGIFLIGSGRKGCRRLRFWAALATGIWVFSILCMLGRHTPFYYLFFKLVPVLSNFPFPIRYRMLQCVATACLAGLGVEYLRRFSKAWPARIVWTYLGIVALFVALALIWPQDLTSDRLGHIQSKDAAWAFPGVREIFIRGEGPWFIGGPVYYLLASAVILILVWRGLRGRLRVFVIAVLVMLETAVFTAAGFYFCTFERRFPRPEHFRVTRLEEHPMVQRIIGPFAAFRSDANLRWATDQPFHDNFARLEGSFALMGYDMKPLEKQFKKAIEEAYDFSVDWPIYWHYPRAKYIGFLNNMSVGYLMDSKPESPFDGGKSTCFEFSPDYFIHANPQALPRVFTLDRIVQASSDEQRQELVAGDLKRAVFLTSVPPEAIGAQLMLYREFREWVAQTDVDFENDENNTMLIDHRHFAELQKMNKIVRMDFSQSNSIEVDLKVTKPAMLVLTEVWYPGWKALVDEKPVEVYRVNYFQRGIWLDKGKHQVRLFFQPAAWKVGAIISVISWSLLLLITVGAKIFGGTRFVKKSDNF